MHRSPKGNIGPVRKSILLNTTYHARSHLWFVLCAIGALILAVGVGTLPTQAQDGTNLLYNGNFERGFTYRDGCGHVGVSWNCFTNGGQAVYGFYDDQWAPVVAEGGHSQLIEINTKGLGLGTDDRYAGIFQTVRLAPGAAYQVNLKGMIRSTTPDDGKLDPWRYRVQFGWSVGRRADWRIVTNWVDVGWDVYDSRLEPTTFNAFRAKFIAQEPQVTVYVRVWKKWGTTGEEIDINFDSISLLRTTADSSVLPLLTATPTQVISPLTLLGGTPVISLPEPTPDVDRIRLLPTGPNAVTDWPRFAVNRFAFSYPSTWLPLPLELTNDAVIEKYLLGIPNFAGENSIGFSSIPLRDLRPPDLIATSPFMIGGKEGVKWLRQSFNYVGYQYCTSGPGDVGSFCVIVTMPVANPMIELQLDYLVKSIDFY